MLFHFPKLNRCFRQISKTNHPFLFKSSTTNVRALFRYAQIVGLLWLPKVNLSFCRFSRESRSSCSPPSTQIGWIIRCTPRCHTNAFASAPIRGTSAPFCSPDAMSSSPRCSPNEHRTYSSLFMVSFRLPPSSTLYIRPHVYKLRKPFELPSVVCRSKPLRITL